MKAILDVRSAPPSHWVGDGFPVRSLFSYNAVDLPLSPFLLLDYAGPARFTATHRRRGVGAHPHRGFETVTLVYSGEVEHRDSSGGGGVIGPGDVQWMTAGDGIVHDEFHSEAFGRRGGELEMVQLWVNLPARHKRTKPRYQALTSAQIPVLELPDGAGSLRLIAGELDGQRGAAETFSSVDVWDVRLEAGKRVALPSAAGRTLIVAVLQGTVRLGEARSVGEAQVAIFDPRGEGVALEAHTDARLLVLGGEPLNEPVVGYGPFVMNDKAGIRESIDAFNSGRFGHVR